MYIRNLIYGNEYIMPVYFLFGLWLYVNIQLQRTNIVHTTHMSIRSLMNNWGFEFMHKLINYGLDLGMKIENSVTTISRL